MAQNPAAERIVRCGILEHIHGVCVCVCVPTVQSNRQEAAESMGAETSGVEYAVSCVSRWLP